MVNNSAALGCPEVLGVKEAGPQILAAKPRRRERNLCGLGSARTLRPGPAAWDLQASSSGWQFPSSLPPS